MFTTKWSTSERKYDVIVERDVKVSMPDGTLLDGNIYRPASSERFPVILGAHAYNKDLQSPPMRPVGFTPMRGYMESGDSTFYARRGYVHAVFNVRGSGKSGGYYQLMGPLEVQDISSLIDWLAAQSWSTGDVGMFGVSYFARLAKAVAAMGPKPLKAIFSPHSPAPTITATVVITAGFWRMALSLTGGTACTDRTTVACTKKRTARLLIKTPSLRRCVTKRSWRCRGCAKRCRIRRRELTR